MALVDQSQYTELNYTVYSTLQDKLTALLAGSILLIKNFELKEGADVLVQIAQNKYTVSQISYDMSDTVLNPRYWITYNIGINDLSLFTTFLYDETTFGYANKYMINDTVSYISSDGTQDVAIVEAVYVNNTDPTLFAYKLSRDNNGVYDENGLSQDKYM
jgi:hypothetical protein